MQCTNCLEETPRQRQFFEVLWAQPQMLGLCVYCQKKFTLIDGAACVGCGRQQKGTKTCSDCVSWAENFPEKVNNRALYVYDEAFADWMERYKFRGAYHLRHTFAPALRDFFPSFKEGIVVPIPLAPERRESRGFNQVSGFLEAADIAYVELLEKKVHTKAQSSKTKKERMALPQVFTATADARYLNQKIILVDDIYTTGQTLVQAQKALMAKGYTVISSFT